MWTNKTYKLSHTFMALKRALRRNSDMQTGGTTSAGILHTAREAALIETPNSPASRLTPSSRPLSSMMATPSDISFQRITNTLSIPALDTAMYGTMGLT